MIPDDPEAALARKDTELEKLTAALEFCVRDCCARPWPEAGDRLVLSADPCESCERAAAALSETP